MKHRLALAVSVLALAAAGAAGANTIGSVAALNQDVEGTPPAGEKRTLILGDGVVQDELIESSPIGSGQLMFLDQTTMTVAKNSSIVLDRYVYDPETKTGEIALSMSKGVMRFIGGRITKGSDAIITTPTATIGIRGGMSIITVDADGSTRAMHIAGTYTKVTTAGGGEVTVTRSNGMAEVSPAGEVTYIGLPNRAYLNAVINDLIGRGEAGEEVDPQDPDVVESGIIVVNSEAKGVVAEKPVATTGESSDDGGDDENPLIIRNEEEVQTTVVNGTPPGVLLPDVTGGAATSGSGIGGLTTDGGVEFPFDQVFEGSRIGLTADGVAFIVPTDATGFSTFGPPDGSSPEGFTTGTVFFDPTAEFTFSVFTTELGSTGYFLAGTPSGAPGTPAEGTADVYAYNLSDDLFFGEVSEGELGGATPFLPGNLTGFGSEGATPLYIILDDSSQSLNTNNEALYAYLDINGSGTSQSTGLGVLTADVFFTETGQPIFQDEFVGVFNDNDGPTTNVIAAARPVEDGQGNAVFGPDGMYFAIGNGGFDGEGGTFAQASIAFDRDENVTLYGNNAIATQVDAATLTAEDRGGVGDLSGYAAVAAADGAPGPYAAYNVDPTDVAISSFNEITNLTSNFALTEILAIDEEPELTSLEIGAGGGFRWSSYLDEKTFAMQDNQTDRINGETAIGEIVLATAGLVGDGGVFPEGVETAPQYLTWGWWGGPVDGLSGVDPAIAEQDLNLGVFVAGDLSDTGDIPEAGSATYEGFAVVSATRDGATFVDGAGFGLTYDFGRGTGTIGFDDLLGDSPEFAVSAEEPRGYGGVGSMTALGSEALVAVAGDFFTGGELEGIGATAGSVQVLALDGSLTGAGVYGGDATSFTPALVEP